MRPGAAPAAPATYAEVAVPRFRVEVLETRRFVYYIDADSAGSAAERAESADVGTSVSDSFEEQVVGGVTQVEDDA